MCFVPAYFEMIGMVLLAPGILGITVLDAAIMGAVVELLTWQIISDSISTKGMFSGLFHG